VEEVINKHIILDVNNGKTMIGYEKTPSMHDVADPWLF
jgi:hypothetical protein